MASQSARFHSRGKAADKGHSWTTAPGTWQLTGRLPPSICGGSLKRDLPARKSRAPRSWAVGWVLQQRVAARAIATQRMSWDAIRPADPQSRVVGRHRRGGHRADPLAAWALQDGAITLVEPLMVASLFFAFAFLSGSRTPSDLPARGHRNAAPSPSRSAMFPGRRPPACDGQLACRHCSPCCWPPAARAAPSWSSSAPSRGVRRPARPAVAHRPTATAAAAGSSMRFRTWPTRGAIVAARPWAGSFRWCISLGRTSCSSAPPPACCSPRRRFRSARPGTGRCHRRAAVQAALAGGVALRRSGVLERPHHRQPAANLPSRRSSIVVGHRRRHGDGPAHARPCTTPGMAPGTGSLPGKRAAPARTRFPAFTAGRGETGPGRR